MLACRVDEIQADRYQAVSLLQTKYGGNIVLSCRALGLSPSLGDVALLRAVFETRGEAGLALVQGYFAFAYWDQAKKELTLVRDYGRGDSLFFYRGRGFVVFASHLPELLSHPDVPRELDDVVLASILAGDRRQQRKTPFRDIEHVPTRHAVIITRDTIDHRIYWKPVLHDTPLYSRDEDYIERARELLDRAVSRALKDSPRFAVSASGGLEFQRSCSDLGTPGAVAHSLLYLDSGRGRRSFRDQTRICQRTADDRVAGGAIPRATLSLSEAVRSSPLRSIR